jgi:S-adenosylmethionine:tRNA ribosyltransferase-isomerase
LRTGQLREPVYDLAAYDYELPPEMIAQKPLRQRDHSRMLVLQRDHGILRHDYFFNLPDYLEPGDLLVLNDTRVIPARLRGRRTDSGLPVELLLLYPEVGTGWVAMVRPGRRLKPGARINFGNELEALIKDYRETGKRLVQFCCSPGQLEEKINRLGEVPLPPYIINQGSVLPGAYQTVYARHRGSAAAPTAGFHFTPAVFEALNKKGVRQAFLTLHIGPGTFQPVKKADIREHRMHREYYRLPVETARAINRARRERRRVVAVGTTTCRVLETVAGKDGSVQAGEGWSELFIYPGFNFRVVDALLTNFHLPCHFSLSCI